MYHVPDWARPTHPVLRHLLQRGTRQQSPARRWFMRAMAAAILGGLLLSSYSMVRQDKPMLLTNELATPALTVLYFPLVMLQFVGVMLASMMTMQSPASELGPGTWEHLRLTSHGEQLVFRARWVAVFYRLRWLIALLVVPRVFAVLLLVVDATGDQGRLISLHAAALTPTTPTGVALLQLAAHVTAALLYVPVQIGLCAACGLVIAAVVRQPALLSILRVAVPVLLHILLIISLIAGAEVLDHPVWQSFGDPGMASLWRKLLLFNLAGDWGLRMLHLGTTLQTWRAVDYAAWIGPALLAFVLVELVATKVMVELATWYASRPARR